MRISNIQEIGDAGETTRDAGDHKIICPIEHPCEPYVDPDK